MKTIDLAKEYNDVGLGMKEISEQPGPNLCGASSG
ncbi:hypothetical protein BH10PLA2_BH10PLA2_40250 [soil metagenome]